MRPRPVGHAAVGKAWRTSVDGRTAGRSGRSWAENKRYFRGMSDPRVGEQVPVPATPRPAVSRTFAPEAASVPAARRFVREAVATGGHDAWVDDAQLAVSEIATNAVLHAHTPFEVTVQVEPDGVYVQVWDDDATPPAQRASDPTSTTGRGMAVVAAVAAAHGVQSVGPTKVVWFCVGAARPHYAEEVMLDRWSDHGIPAVPAGGGARRVVLIGMPLSLWLAAREHHNGLMREFSLHQQAVQSRKGHIPERLVAADRARSVVLAAVRASPVEPRLDLALDVRPEQATWFEALRDVLDEAERMASAGELLAPPGPQLVLDVRRWACGQVLDQLGGAPPTAWDGPLELPPPSPHAPAG